MSFASRPVSAAAQAARSIQQLEHGMATRPVCQCTGACRPNIANCPAQIAARMPWNERVEYAARHWEEHGRADVAGLIRKAKRSWWSGLFQITRRAA